MPAEWLSGHILDRGDDAREMYSYSLEGQNELLQFLKAIRPEWSFPKKNGKSNVRSVMDKLKAVGVTTVWELFRAVMRNTINEDLAQAGYSVLSKETLDRIRNRRSFFRQLDVLTETDCRQTGAFAPVPQLLSQKKLAYWSKVPSHHDGRKFDERPQSPERASRSGHFENRLFVSNGSSEVIEVDGRDMCRPRLRGARTCIRRGHEIEPFRATEKSEAEMSQDKDRWALKSALRPPALAKTWQAGDNKATCSSSLESGDKPPKTGLLREASQVSISGGDDSHTLRDGSTETRTRLGSGQSSFLFMTPQQRARSSSVDHSSSGQALVDSSLEVAEEADTLLVTVVKLQQEAAAMQDFRPPSWSVLRRHENALIESGQVWDLRVSRFHSCSANAPD
eukprot:s2911_g10.t1